MILFFIAILAIIQGLTEFLPVSSSAHIILLSKFFSGFGRVAGNAENTLTISIALHLGSLIAVMFFYRHDILQMITFKNMTLIWKIFFAFLPVAIIGGAITIMGVSLPESTVIIGAMLIVFGAVLYLADKYGREEKSIENINIMQAFVIGCCQLVALIPGVSRSGITITGGRLVGLKRAQAVKFSLLLSIPTIGASSFLLLYKFISQPFDKSQMSLLSLIVVAFVMSAIASYIVLRVFVKMVNKFNLTPFVVYRILLGFLLLILV